jgi:hypothetical protein
MRLSPDTAAATLKGWLVEGVAFLERGVATVESVGVVDGADHARLGRQATLKDHRSSTIFPLPFSH